MKVRPYKYANGAERWCLDYGVIGGKRKREFFPDEEAAGKALKAAQKDARKHGTESLAMGMGDRLRFELYCRHVRLNVYIPTCIR